MQDENEPSIDKIDDDIIPETPAAEFLKEEVPLPTVEEKSAPPPVINDRPPHKVEMDKEYSYPLPDGDKDSPSVKLPSDFTKATFDAYRYLRSVNVDVKNPAIAKWMAAVEDGWKLNTEDELLEPRLNEGDWATHIPTSKGDISIKQGQLASAKGTKLTDLSVAKWRVLNHIGSGNVVQVYLYHSGFWVTITPPTDEELLELYRIINKDKISLGRFTYGALYNNLSAMTTKRFTDFIMDHIDDATVRLDREGSIALQDIIVPQDIPLLELGMLAALWPDGVHYERGCSKDPQKCHHVTEGLLDLTELFHFDRSDLEDWMVTHITTRKKNSLPVKNIRRYQEAMVKKEVVEVIPFGLGKEITVHYRTPSLQDHVDSGLRWINDINETIEESLGEEPTDDKRNKYMQENALATYLRQYSHWVSYIDMGDDGYASRDDTESDGESVPISTVLGWLSSNKTVTEQVMSQIADYINEHTRALVGIKNHVCPNCNKEQLETTGSLALTEHVLPLDITRMFFRMLALKVGGILARQAM